MSGDPKLGNQPINATYMLGVDLDVDPDFNERANLLWSFYRTVAKEQDKATCNTAAGVFLNLTKSRVT